MKARWMGMIAATGLLLAGSALAADEAALAQKSGCMACHQVAVKVVGPAYKDVAKKYAGNAKAADMLVKKVTTGGTGVWGQIPMPAQSSSKGGTVKDEDIKKLVAWILTTK
jgi:cytochrome c